MPVHNIGGTRPGLCTGKKFLVTGGARGIGKAVVAELHAQGAIIYALSRNPENLKALKLEFPSVTTICADLADWEETRRAVENLEPMDCLINNAAVSLPASFWETTSDDFDTLFKTNLKAVLNVSQVVAKKMVERGTGGSIVNVSSVAGKKVFPACIGYGCLKAALEMMSKGMALELAPHKITVNSVCPGAVDTDMLRDALENKDPNSTFDAKELISYMKSKTPTNVYIMPMSDIVNSILFFGSGLTSQITGESLLIDGGFKISF